MDRSELQIFFNINWHKFLYTWYIMNHKLKHIFIHTNVEQFKFASSSAKHWVYLNAMPFKRGWGQNLWCQNLIVYYQIYNEIHIKYNYDSCKTSFKYMLDIYISSLLYIFTDIMDIIKKVMGGIKSGMWPTS